MKVPSARSHRAFTLIELLVVISIIAILATLLVPAVGRAMYNAQKTKAKNDAVQIASAINAYQAEYGKLPTKESQDVSDQDPSGQLMDALSPANGTDTTGLNPRLISFLSVPKAISGKNGRLNGNQGPYLDPWGQGYYIAMDADYNGTVQGPSGTSATGDIRQSVLVWSKGDTIGHKEETTHPEKWIKSWE